MICSPSATTIVARTNVRLIAKLSDHRGCSGCSRSCLFVTD